MTEPRPEAVERGMRRAALLRAGDRPPLFSDRGMERIVEDLAGVEVVPEWKIEAASKQTTDGRRRPLTIRQAALLGLLARGRSHEAAAKELGCSRQNVTNLVVAAKYALGTDSLFEAVALAVGHGYVEVNQLPVYAPEHRPKATAKRRTAKAKLSPREVQILGLIVQGFTNEEIIAELKTSKDTIKDQVSSLLAKIGARNRTQAAVFAITRRLVDPPPDGPPIRRSRSG